MSINYLTLFKWRIAIGLAKKVLRNSIWIIDGTTRMHVLDYCCLRASFCNYLTQRACTRAISTWNISAAASVSGQESCRVAIRSHAKVNTRADFPQNLHRRQSDGDRAKRATNFAKFTSQLLKFLAGTRRRILCKISLTRRIRTVRVFYILLLRENTTRTLHHCITYDAINPQPRWRNLASSR